VSLVNVMCTNREGKPKSATRASSPTEPANYVSGPLMGRARSRADEAVVVHTELVRKACTMDWPDGDKVNGGESEQRVGGSRCKLPVYRSPYLSFI